MQKLIAALFVLLPATALSHHDHEGVSAIMHHGLEFSLLAIALIAAYALYRRGQRSK